MRVIVTERSSKKQYYSLVLNTSHGTPNKDSYNFPPNSFIATWSLSKKCAMSTIAPWSEIFPCYFKAIMMSLFHLQRATVFCNPTWSLSKWFRMSCNANMFLKIADSPEGQTAAGGWSQWFV